MGFYSFCKLAEPFDVDVQMVTSYLMSPWWLAGGRLFLGVYAVAVLISEFIYSATVEHQAGTLVSFFTILTYIGICAYMFAAGVQTWCYARTGREPLQRWPRFLQLCHHVLQTTAITMPFLVTIVFWAILAPAKDPFTTTYLTFSNISLHMLNSLFALLEIFAFSTTASPPWVHLMWLILILLLYLCVAYITLASEDFLVYSFLNPDHGGLVAAYVFGVALAMCVVFSIVKGVVILRTRLYERTFNRSPILSAKHIAVHEGLGTEIANEKEKEPSIAQESV